MGKPRSGLGNTRLLLSYHPLQIAGVEPNKNLPFPHGVPFSRLDPAAGLDDVLLLAATETTTLEDIAALAAALSRSLGR